MCIHINSQYLDHCYIYQTVETTHQDTLPSQMARLVQDYEKLEKQRENLKQTINELKTYIRVKTKELAVMQTEHIKTKKRLDILIKGSFDQD